jgi:alkanesulfonate monooxygenase SsuD/methylene tetrahydromethanopterin reductase-like flavin-dependent oxidoreductase (luciferase family)
MRALWTEEEASYDGEFVKFGASWAYPKPPQGRIPVIIGAGAGPKTFEWIARNADGWMTTPASTEVAANADKMRKAWADAGREDSPDVRILVAKRPTEEDFADWMAAGASELIWGVPDADRDTVLGYLDKMAGRLGLSGA